MGYTTVRVNVGALIIDGVDDDDIYDDVPVSGKLLLEPMIEPGRPVQVSDAGRMKIKAIAPFPVDIGLNGEISYRNRDFVTVPAPTSATSNVAQLQWRATFQDLKYGTSKVTVPPIFFWAEPGLQVDLGDHINIAPSPTAVQLSRGARGFGVVGAVPVEDEPTPAFAIEYETSTGTALSDPIPLPEGSGGGLTEEVADTRYVPVSPTATYTYETAPDGSKRIKTETKNGVTMTYVYDDAHDGRIATQSDGTTTWTFNYDTDGLMLGVGA
jgi:hypothetical protein